VDEDEVQRCMADESNIQNALNKLGFNQVVVDPKGYRQGSLNEGVVK
jgi:PP-loop superfamily ATP-utilizing enzyme